MKIGKQLKKMAAGGSIESSTALELLNVLKKQKMTLDVLQQTRIGMTVNTFRKECNDQEVITLAKTLIKTWKKLLSGETSSQDSNSSLSRSNSSMSTSRDDDNSQDGAKDDSPSEEADPQGGGDSAPPKSSGSSTASETSDSVRLKCREMLAAALKTDPQPENVDACHDDLGACIEDSIFDEFSSTDSKYKARVRSRISNLKDPKNPQLRENVLRGHLPPERIAKMTAEEMANKEMQEMRAKFTKEAINDHQMATTGGTTTDLLQCGKCRARNCTYNQVQTRSADEPMTTFVLCNNCGNRWKFC